MPVLVQTRIKRQLVPLIEENLAKANFTLVKLNGISDVLDIMH